MARIDEVTLWPGIASFEVRTTFDGLDVTAFGDVNPVYVAAGAPRCEVHITCDKATVDRLLAVLGAPPPARDGDPSPPQKLAVRPVRWIDLEG